MMVLRVKGMPLRELPGDVRILFATRLARLFAYGFLSVVLVLYLAALGLAAAQVGLLLTLTLVGDTAISLVMTTKADRLGRRRTLMLGAVLMTLAGVLFAFTDNYWFLVAAATIGVISPSGNEVGPFLPIEQAALSQLVPNRQRTRIFAWYVLIGSFATALGALAGGVLSGFLQANGMPAVSSYRVTILGYAAIGLGLAFLFTRLSSAAEAPISMPSDKSSTLLANQLGLAKSFGVVMRLGALFALDAFAGAFVLQTFVAYWFHIRYGVEPALLGGIFFAANILAGISALAAARIAARIGLINTMVFTHLPSNILLILVPLMPTLPLAIILFLFRFTISQMDVPTRESYTMAIVPADERSAAAGVTGVARTTGAALAPVIAGTLLGATVLLSVPFFLAGGLKIIYDLMLYRNFKRVKPPEEELQVQAAGMR
jgi:MFS family permease